MHWPPVSTGLQSIIVGSSCDVERVALVVVLVSFVASLLIAGGLAASVYMPRNPRTGKSNIFFEDIAAMAFPEFESAARNMSNDVIERQLIDQIYRVSRVRQHQDETSSLGPYGRARQRSRWG